MAVICIDESTNEEHDFTNDFTKFLEGEIGNYDGGFNSVEQFEEYLESLDSENPNSENPDSENPDSEVDFYSLSRLGQDMYDADSMFKESALFEFV